MTCFGKRLTCPMLTPPMHTLSWTHTPKLVRPGFASQLCLLQALRVGVPAADSGEQGQSSLPHQTSAKPDLLPLDKKHHCHSECTMLSLLTGLCVLFDFPPRKRWLTFPHLPPSQDKKREEMVVLGALSQRSSSTQTVTSDPGREWSPPARPPSSWVQLTLSLPCTGTKEGTDLQMR